MSDFIDIGPECFADAAKTVISYKGEIFYKTCGSFVREIEGGAAWCVKRKGHPSSVHEDFDGETRDEPNRNEKHVNTFADCTNVNDLLGQAVGLVSTCWEKLDDAGEFESERASKIVDDVKDRLVELWSMPLNIHDCSTAELLAELQKRYPS